jgi:hypothetical protein
MIRAIHPNKLFKDIFNASVAILFATFAAVSSFTAYLFVLVRNVTKAFVIAVFKSDPYANSSAINLSN